MKIPCGCCGGIETITPEPEYNRPGLPAISYRVGSYATFFETMLARLSSVFIDVVSDSQTGGTVRTYPLKALTTREPGDPAIAILDAWAVVADVLTFYQERIANEGYLLTATERLSLLELARLIGYRPRPGVSASVFLAFTTATGFSGEIPAGTRAQSQPGTGETAQYFETSAKLVARDTWNSLSPRLTQPQVISPPPDPALKFDNHLGTNADIIDTIYFQGIATNLKAGDPILLVLSDDHGQQFLRFAERVDPQTDQGRTLVALRENAVFGLEASVEALQRFINDAPIQFIGSDLAASAASSLQGILDLIKLGPGAGATQARAALPLIRAAHDVAVNREFTRVEVWLQHLLDLMPEVISVLTTEARRAHETVVAQPSFAQSSLQTLGALLPALSVRPNVQLANPLRLRRSIALSFGAHADTMPRLFAALNPIAAPMVYNAWGSVEPVHIDLRTYAVRAKAGLFASNFTGASQFTPAHPNAAGDATVPGQTTFAQATLASTWLDLIPPRATALTVIALDSVYDKITVNSWIAVSKPDLTADNRLATRIVTYHQVMDVQSASLDTGTGFTAKVSVLSLNSAWLLANSPAEFDNLTGSALLLRGTVVYAQTEPLSLAEEPLDRDVEGHSIELDGLFDGLEPGRWVIVSGTRTDIPNVTGVQASELMMISAVTQGVGKEACVPSLPNFVPFDALLYISDENADGDRLVVGVPTTELVRLLTQIPLPTAVNQEFCDPVQLCPGLYADAYVPTAAERTGVFTAFAQQLINPDKPPTPFQAATIPAGANVFAWRIRRLTSGSETVHTTIQFAKGLAYRYDTAGINIYANVANATHGQTTGEILGNGDSSQAFQKFGLHQRPLTFLSAATAEGSTSTLSVRVNEMEREEAKDLSGVGPTDRVYVTQTDDSDQTTVIFGNGEHGARIPTGSSNVKASYRYGIGSPGNVKARQINQLAMHPLGLQGVFNPLAATGGADRDTLDQVRRNAPLAVAALDRLVSVQDYADFARTYAGISKASATPISDGRRQLVHLTIAGAGDTPIDLNSDLYQNFVLSLRNFGDPMQPVQVCIRRVKLLVISARVKLQPAFAWESVAPQIRAAVQAGFAFDQRDLGQPAFMSEVIAMIQGIPGVLYVDVQVFDSVAENTTADELSKLAAKLAPNPIITADLAHLNPSAAQDAGPCDRIVATELVFLTPDIPDTFILNQIGA